MEVFLYRHPNVQPFKTTKWASPQENTGFNLSKYIEAAIKNYFESLGDEWPANVYWQALKETKKQPYKSGQAAWHWPWQFSNEVKSAWFYGKKKERTPIIKKLMLKGDNGYYCTW